MAGSVHKVDISWDRRPAGTVATVVFDNSRRLNVVGPPALLDLTEAFLGLASEDDLRVVVFSGAGGKAFGFAMGVLVPGIVERSADQVLGDAEREGRTVGELARHLVGLGREVGLRHDPVEDVVGLGFLGTESFA